MYKYDAVDKTIVTERAAQFRDQVQRHLAGELSAADLAPLRLRNGLYMQIHAHMLRVAIPYGLVNSEQMRALAHISRKYDRGYGHFTTRQNIQFNWPELAEVPDILDDLANVEMHATQTSGNCIRNISSDQYAGVATDEIIDPRPYCEILRQWSTLHPEFYWLPRKFKFAVTGATNDRAAVQFHDIGLEVVYNDKQEIGFRVYVGGGLGRTPVIGKVIKEFLPREDILSYCDSMLRVYNLHGRRDNKYKARIKILVKETGIETFREQVEAEYAAIDISDIVVSQAERDRITAYFASPDFEKLENDPSELTEALENNRDFQLWAKNNVAAHKADGYAIANISLKPKELAPGDITAEQMRVVSDLADKYSFGELRSTHQQNLVLPHVKQSDLPDLFAELQAAGLASDNINLITDIICCPGMDFCALATARSIPISQAIAERFEDPERQRTIGEMQIKISGCINACGHHHVGHIGILGLEKAGVEFYQVKLGGDSSEDAAIGKVTGPGFSQEELIDGIENMVDLYLEKREDGERNYGRNTDMRVS